MPPENASLPPQMTWGRALPILVIAGLFDLSRAFFQLFWFFGPALAATLCTVAGTSSLGLSLFSVQGGATAAVCSATAGAVGFLGAPAFMAFGTIMSMVMGFAGFLTLALLILLTNSRLFREPGTLLWSIGSFALSEIPFISAFPNFTVAVWRLYHTQIKKDAHTVAEAKKKLVAEQTRLAQEEQSMALARFEEMQAATEKAYAVEEAANDEQYEQRVAA